MPHGKVQEGGETKCSQLEGQKRRTVGLRREKCWATERNLRLRVAHIRLLGWLQYGMHWKGIFRLLAKPTFWSFVDTRPLLLPPQRTFLAQPCSRILAGHVIKPAYLLLQITIREEVIEDHFFPSRCHLAAAKVSQSSVSAPLSAWPPT